MTESPTPVSYDESFFDGNRRFADASARTVVALLRGALPISSVADFGCAEGVWLRAWQAAGVEDFLGLDGDYVDRRRLLIPEPRFRAVDLGEPIDVGRRFDLAQSLEVAEHLPASGAPGFVATLIRHSDLVLFSAAPPGQGGFNHVNERPYAYWRDLFAAQGYALFDWVRPQLAGAAGLAPWYRFNTFLFAHASSIGRLPQAVAATRVPNEAPVPDVSPLAYKLRKAVVRRLPQGVQNYVSRLKRRGSGTR